MVKTCCAYRCPSRSGKNVEVSFHKFPKDQGKTQLWVLSMGRDKWKPSPSTFICSNHFTDDCYDSTRMDIRYLKKDAIPSIFEYPPSLQAMFCERICPVETENKDLILESECTPEALDRLWERTQLERKDVRNAASMSSQSVKHAHKSIKQVRANSISSSPLVVHVKSCESDDDEFLMNSDASSSERSVHGKGYSDVEDHLMNTECSDPFKALISDVDNQDMMEKLSTEKKLLYSRLCKPGGSDDPQTLHMKLYIVLDILKEKNKQLNAARAKNRRLLRSNHSLSLRLKKLKDSDFIQTSKSASSFI